LGVDFGDVPIVDFAVAVGGVAFREAVEVVAVVKLPIELIGCGCDVGVA